MTKDEKNRKIAEWLCAVTRCSFPECDGHAPDFFTDEAANARVLEKIPYVQLSYSEIQQWSVSWSNSIGRTRTSQHMDRKTAICEAALRLMVEKPREQG